MMTIMVIAKEKLKHSFCKKNPLRSIGTQTTLTKQSQYLVTNIDIFYFLHVDNLKSKKTHTWIMDQSWVWSGRG